MPYAASLEYVNVKTNKNNKKQKFFTYFWVNVVSCATLNDHSLQNYDRKQCT